MPLISDACAVVPPSPAAISANIFNILILFMILLQRDEAHV
jgi:hypothetical protein